MSMEAASSDGKGKEPLKKRLVLFRCGEGIHLLASPSSGSGASSATTGGGRPRSVSNSRPSSPRVSSSSNLASLGGGADSILAFGQNNSSSTNLSNLATATATSTGAVGSSPSSIVDPGLSEKGWEDARALKSAFELSLSSLSLSSSSSLSFSSSGSSSGSNVYSLKPDIIITSTLKRALQMTSILKEQFPSTKAVGDELCRESLTRYEYNRRSPISELAAEFTTIDFSSCTLNEDTLHSSEHNADFRELYANLRSRAGRFLAFIEQSSHQNVIVISHNHFIRNLLAEVVGIDKNHCLTAIKHGKGVSLSWTLDDGWHLETPLQVTSVDTYTNMHGVA